jgi:hypothetical protein
MAAPLVVHIQPVGPQHNVYDAFVFNRFLLGPTRTPYIDTANVLLNLGYDPYRQLFMRRRGVNVNQMNYTLIQAATLGVEDERNPPFLYPLGQDGPGAVP